MNGDRVLICNLCPKANLLKVEIDLGEFLAILSLSLSVADLLQQQKKGRCRILSSSPMLNTACQSDQNPSALDRTGSGSIGTVGLRPSVRPSIHDCWLWSIRLSHYKRTPKDH